MCRGQQESEVEQDGVSVVLSSARFLSVRLFGADLQAVTVPYLNPPPSSVRPCCQRGDTVPPSAGSSLSASAKRRLTPPSLDKRGSFPRRKFPSCLHVCSSLHVVSASVRCSAGPRTHAQTFYVQCLPFFEEARYLR